MCSQIRGKESSLPETIIAYNMLAKLVCMCWPVLQHGLIGMTHKVSPATLAFMRPFYRLLQKINGNLLTKKCYTLLQPHIQLA